MKKLIILCVMLLLPMSANATKVGVLDMPMYCGHSEFKKCKSYWQPQFADTYLSHHGTAVASIIAGKNVGVSPNAQLYTFDLFYHPYSPWEGWWIGDMTDDYGNTIEESSIWYGKQLGVTVFNQSYGSPDGNIHPMMLNIWNKNQDVLFVNAGGNNGKVVNSPGPIGGNVILVGSVDGNNKRAWWSNKPGHALKQHWIMAPGVNILAAGAFGGGGMMYVSGTSFSAPIVTGAVAELQDRYPHLRNNPSSTKHYILTTATDLGPAGVDAEYGWGLLNLNKAILQVGIDTYTPPPANNDVPYISGPSFGADGKYDFAFQFTANEYGEMNIPNMRFSLTPELSLGYLYTDHNYSPSLNYSKAGLSLTMAYTEVEGQTDVDYTPMLGASASYFKAFEMTKKSDLELTANIPMFTFKGYASMDDERVSYVQDPDYQLWLRWKGTF